MWSYTISSFCFEKKTLNGGWNKYCDTSPWEITWVAVCNIHAFGVVKKWFLFTSPIVSSTASHTSTHPATCVICYPQGTQGKQESKYQMKNDHPKLFPIKLPMFFPLKRISKISPLACKCIHWLQGIKTRRPHSQPPPLPTFPFCAAAARRGKRKKPCKAGNFGFSFKCFLLSLEFRDFFPSKSRKNKRIPAFNIPQNILVPFVQIDITVILDDLMTSREFLFRLVIFHIPMHGKLVRCSCHHLYEMGFRKQGQSSLFGSE